MEVRIESAATAWVDRRARRGPTAIDAAVALLALTLTLVMLRQGAGSSGRHLDPLGALLAAVTSLPLLFRRRAPLGVFALTTAASAVLNGLNYAAGPPFGPTFALFTVAADERARTNVRRTAAVVIGMFAVHVGATVIAHHGFPTSPLLFGVVVWGGAWLIGDVVRQRHRAIAAAIERARQSEHEMARERRLAAAEERTRIARDLHDSAAHAINVILVHAGAARLLQKSDPAAVTTALNTIEEVARETVAEIDTLVHGLRENGDSDRAIEPPAGLAALETLVERYRAAGLTIDVRTEGERRVLPQRLDQAAYRIVQESLTNAARHGTGAAVVEISFGESELELTISNPAPAAPEDGGGERGHGILGMRERAALLGGSLLAGRANDRFEVRGRLPYGGLAAGT